MHLTAYVTKPLHALGIVHLQFDGWAHARDGQFLWDLHRRSAHAGRIADAGDATAHV